MALLSWLKDLKNLHNLYKSDIEAQKTKQALINQGITEDFVRVLVKEADLGVVLEINFPNGAIFRATRTNSGAILETQNASGPGLSFKESF